jgi:hypothetical protein
MDAVTRPTATYAGMPVVIERVDDGSRCVVWVFDHTDTALLLACGGKFPRLGLVQPLAKLMLADDEYDDAGWP